MGGRGEGGGGEEVGGRQGLVVVGEINASSQGEGGLAT